MLTDTLRTVAGNVLALFRERPGVIEPDHLDSALSAYAWALTEDETGIDRNEAHCVTTYRGAPVERVRAARQAQAVAIAHSNRLGRMTRDEIADELERVVGHERAA